MGGTTYMDVIDIGNFLKAISPVILTVGAGVWAVVKFTAMKVAEHVDHDEKRFAKLDTRVAEIERTCVRKDDLDDTLHRMEQRINEGFSSLHHRMDEVYRYLAQGK